MHQSRACFDLQSCFYVKMHASSEFDCICCNTCIVDRTFDRRASDPHKTAMYLEEVIVIQIADNALLKVGSQNIAEWSWLEYKIRGQDDACAVNIAPFWCKVSTDIKKLIESMIGAKGHVCRHWQAWYSESSCLFWTYASPPMSRWHNYPEQSFRLDQDIFHRSL